jgi:dTDP-4-amino-4,6-dideoxygalactose transaminase
VRIRKTIPPAAAPLTCRDLLSGIRGCVDKGIPEQLEDEIRQYFHVDHVFFLSSGKAAFFLILCALKELANRKKVIIPAYTCYSVPSAIRKAGLEIVPCDIRAETLDFDFEQLERLCDEKTLCVVPTHLFGIPSDVSRVREIAERRGIFIVEDAAQALGVSRGKEILGTIGDVAFYSFGRGKNITCGSGGLIITSSGEIAGKIRSLYELLPPEPFKDSLRTFLEVCFMQIFLSPYLYWFPYGLQSLKLGETIFYHNFPVYRLSGVKAGLLRHWRETLEVYNDCRSKIGNYYLKELNLDGTMPIYSSSFPYLRFPVYVKGNCLKNKNYEDCKIFGMTRMYPDSVNNIDEIRGDFIGQNCKNAESIAIDLLTLPTHALVRDRDKAKICNILKSLTDDRSSCRLGCG